MENLSFCTICGFDFDGPGLERIFQHPVLPVPVCAVCYDGLDQEELTNGTGAGEFEFCIWCGEGGELLLCDSCPRSVCEMCIQNQLGSSTLERFRDLSPWNCLACDSSPLASFQDSLHLQSDEKLFPESLESSLSLLSSVEDEILQCQHLHDDDDALNLVLDVIRKELREEGKSQNDIDDEVMEWKQRWDRHWQRMSHRSSELQEHIEVLGGDLNTFYQQRETRTRVWSELYDLDRYAIPESPFSGAEGTADAAGDGTTTYLHYLYRRPESQNPPAVDFHLQIQGDQENYESENEHLLESPELAARAASDLIVQKYAERPNPPPHSFPSCFRRTIPLDVLKALYYVNNFHSDRLHLINEYKIPPSIQTVMKYARSADGFIHSCWPNLDLHPSIRKALYLGSSYDVSTLAGCYGVPSDAHEIEEIDDSCLLKHDSYLPCHLDDLAAFEDEATLKEYQESQKAPPPIRSREEHEDQIDGLLTPRWQKRDRKPQQEFSVKRVRAESCYPGNTTVAVEGKHDPPQLPRSKENYGSKFQEPHDQKIGQGTHLDPVVLQDSDEEVEVISPEPSRVSGKVIGLPRNHQFNPKDNFQVSFREEFEATGTKIMMMRSLSDHLLPHQKEAVQFMWKNTMQGLLSWSPDESGVATPPLGSGCILAHCMGSGKTLSTLSFIATILSNPVISSLREPRSSHPLISRVLIICPVNVLVNWGLEFQRWIPQECRIKQYTVDANLKRASRLETLQSWYNRGGICIIGKELFCIMVEEAKKDNGKECPENSLPLRNASTFLISPGPDIVVLDEAHTVKNSSSRLFNILREIRTQRRISLTGSPLQNNLRELWNMVHFAKSGQFFEWEKFCNLFLRPIEVSQLFHQTTDLFPQEGSTKDASKDQVSQMKKKSYKLNSLLTGVMLRRGVDLLAGELTQKLEFVILLHLTNFQKFLYRLCMDQISKERGRYLFKVNYFQSLLTVCKACKRGSRVWNHPACLPLNVKADFNLCNPRSVMDEIFSQLHPVWNSFKSSPKSTQSIEMISTHSIPIEGGYPSPPTIPAVGDEDVKKFDEEEDTSTDANSWWRDFPEAKVEKVTHADILKLGNKVGATCISFPFHLYLSYLSFQVLMFLLLLGNSVKGGDKVLLFSQSLSTLDFLCTILKLNWGEMLRECCELKNGYGTNFGYWSEGTQYLRLDGTVNATNRQELITKFNRSPLCKLFLVSTMAGNMGINLQSANRVVIFDASWNPANDLQAIFRSYRYGQTKRVYVYRLLAAGTIEERMYKKQVNKLNVSARVVDALMPENAYTYEEMETHILAYDSEADDQSSQAEKKTRRMEQLIRQDLVLLEAFQGMSSHVKSIEDMDSLTMDVVDEHLDANEKEQAEREYEKEIQTSPSLPFPADLPPEPPPLPSLPL